MRIQEKERWEKLGGQEGGKLEEIRFILQGPET